MFVTIPNYDFRKKTVNQQLRDMLQLKIVLGRCELNLEKEKKSIPQKDKDEYVVLVESVNLSELKSGSQTKPCFGY